MGLNATLKTLVKKAVTATGDLASTITYVKRVIGAYDSSTDTTTNTLTTYSLVPALLCKLSEDDMDWFPVNLVGQKILIAYNDLPIETDDADYVVIDGDQWNIHKRRGVPGGSLHILFVTRA